MRFQVLLSIFLVVLSLHVVAENNADQREVTYQDASGKSWHRWILTEYAEDFKYLLLVVDRPDGVPEESLNVSQVTVFRKIYDSMLELEAAKKFYFKNAFSESSKGEFDPLDRKMHAPLWVAQRNWTLDDEKNYAVWVNTQLNTQSFHAQDIQFDCADFAILTRWVYAHDHRLPVASSLPGSNQLVGNWSSRSDWSKLSSNEDWKKDLRFKAAIRYVLNQAYTHTLLNDLYPVQITSDFVTPGSMILMLFSQSTGHTQVIKNIGNDPVNCESSKCVTAIWGNEPATDLSYERAAWIQNVTPDLGGFLRWRWPVQKNQRWILQEPKLMPGYSTEQFQHPEMGTQDYIAWVYDRLGIGGDKFVQINVLLSQIKSMLTSRIEIVNNGFLNCVLAACDPKGSTYDAQSTPHQDLQLKQLAAQFIGLYQQLDQTDPRFGKLNSDLSQTPFIQFSFSSATDLSYRAYIFDLGGLATRMSSDPRDDFALRWGAAPTDLNARFEIFISSWAQMWSDRERLIFEAQAICYPEGGTTPSCSAGDTHVASLNTTQIDQGLRNLAGTLLEAEKNLTAPDLLIAQSTLATINTREYFCAMNPTGQPVACNLNDFLFASKPYLAQMSSDPITSYRARFGY